MNARPGLQRGVWIFLAWLAPFAIWCIWESSIRILLFHEAWTSSTALHYLGANLIFFITWGLLLASLSPLV